ncbi:hemerythrin domain-containing protein [Mycolicibacterium goodii]|uniref:hemerythrin domain-containing protein n=1 Tax=Mycolicibacterium goodii TaxID=134601 RepID=UPI001BDC2C51|nr:hemerythrin domain-containing protein [Mycolicibacterium goodii]MBU8812302.1 hemerythrin domain-containing protein [Mycolicibacterium goodii]ULN45619.1 hemerythrin domain-containing protein [Mycolicibacterium goodii]
MMRSIATQTTSELGGPRSILVRQRRDHVELDRLLCAVDGARGRDRQELLTRLCRLVFPHAFAEESVLWPAARRVLPDGAALTLTVEREHQEINGLFTELEKTDPEDARHRELWSRIESLLRADVRDEEDALLPGLQTALSRRGLVMLGIVWDAVRRIAPTRPHPVVSRRPPGNVLAAVPLTVTDRLRDRLDRYARRSGGVRAVAAQRISARLAKVAGAVEHVPPLTHGEDLSTRDPEAT